MQGKVGVINWAYSSPDEYVVHLQLMLASNTDMFSYSCVVSEELTLTV